MVGESEYRGETRNIPLTSMLHQDQALNFYFDGQQVASLHGMDTRTQLSGHAFDYFRERLPALSEGMTVLFPTDINPSLPMHMGTVRQVIEDGDALVYLTDAGRAVIYFEGIDLPQDLAGRVEDAESGEARFPRVLE